MRPKKCVCVCVIHTLNIHKFIIYFCRLFTHWTILIDLNMIDVMFLFDLLCVMVTEYDSVDTAVDSCEWIWSTFTTHTLTHTHSWYGVFAKKKNPHIISSSPLPPSSSTTSESLRTRIPSSTNICNQLNLFP